MSFAYKNFYVYDLSLLCRQIIPDNPFQRMIDRGRVDIIKEALLREKNQSNTPEVQQTGAIQIGYYQENIFYIIDGQHRFQAYRELNEPKNVVVQIWKCANEEDMRRKFIEINSNVPIESYVMNPTSQKSVYDSVIEYVQKEYKNYLKSSDRPIFPNINIEHFRKIVDLIPELRSSTKDSAIYDFETYNKKCLTELATNKKERDRYVKCKSEGIRLYINRSMAALYNQKLEIEKLT